MKARLAILFCSFISLGSMAQQDQQQAVNTTQTRRSGIEYRHDLRLGIGTPPPRDIQKEYCEPSNSPEESTTPNFYMFYGYRIIKGLKVVGTISYYNDYKERIRPGHAGSGSDFYASNSGLNHHVRITPGVQYEWYNRGIVTMYSELGLTFDITKRYDHHQGVTYHDDVKLYVRPNVTPFGITVGRKLFGFAEVLSFGPRGFINAGIGYRF